MFRHFFSRLFLTPNFWASLIPGVVVVLLDGYCKNGLVNADWLVCRLDFFQHISTTSGSVTLVADGLLYTVLRFLDARNLYQLNGKISWIIEIALLVIGQYLLFVSVMILALVTMTGI
jgi:hypothetical protein